MTPLDNIVRSEAAEAGALRPPHVDFLGLPFCLLSPAQTLDLILARRGAIRQESLIYLTVSGPLA